VQVYLCGNALLEFTTKGGQYRNVKYLHPSSDTANPSLSVSEAVSRGAEKELAFRRGMVALMPKEKNVS